MIELNLADLSKICIQHLQVLASVRCLCVKQDLNVEWLQAWEAEIAGSMKELRLLKEAKGDVLIVED